MTSALLSPASRTVLVAATPVVAWTVVRELVLRRQIEAARRDPLTGLRTRAAWSEQARGVLRRAARTQHGGQAVVLLLDLDGFKRVNDTYGHAAGDDLLIEVGARLSRWCERHAGVAGRLGGDEFVAVYRTSAAGGGLLDQVRQLHGELGLPVEVHRAGELQPWASIGVAGTSDHPGADLAGLLQRADSAMYVAKVGRSGVHLADQWLPQVEPVNGRRPGRAGTSSPSFASTSHSQEAAA